MHRSLELLLTLGVHVQRRLRYLLVPAALGKVLDRFVAGICGNVEQA